MSSHREGPWSPYIKRGGPDCSSKSFDRHYCYTDIGACADGRSTTEVANSERSLDACDVAMTIVLSIGTTTDYTIPGVVAATATYAAPPAVVAALLGLAAIAARLHPTENKLARYVVIISTIGGIALLIAATRLPMIITEGIYDDGDAIDSLSSSDAGQIELLQATTGFWDDDNRRLLHRYLLSLGTELGRHELRCNAQITRPSTSERDRQIDR